MLDEIKYRILFRKDQSLLRYLRALLLALLPGERGGQPYVSVMSATQMNITCPRIAHTFFSR